METKTIKSLRIGISNLIASIRMRFTKEPYLRNDDGRLVPLDEWEGYETCMRPGCGHYRCEHSFGEVWNTVYVDPKLKNPDLKVGDVTSWPVGCMNAGCKCLGFWTASDLIGYIQRLTHARKDSAYVLEQVPGVIHVESGVSITVWVDTYTESREESVRDTIYETERSLHNKYPGEAGSGVLFDFNTRWDKPPED
jgi:hypothetical protein